MKLILNLTAALFLSSIAQSASAFPSGWEKWTKVNTPLADVGALPGCDADVSKLPVIYQETVATYCALGKKGPGKVAILVNPKALKNYKSRKKEGKFPDGANMILHLKDMGVLFVTYHKANKPAYKIFNQKTKKEMNDPSISVDPNSCMTCHSGYQDYCVNGQCGKITK